MSWCVIYGMAVMVMGVLNEWGVCVRTLSFSYLRFTLPVFVFAITALLV